MGKRRKIKSREPSKQLIVKTCTYDFLKKKKERKKKKRRILVAGREGGEVRF